MAGDDTSPGLLPSGSEKVGGSRSNLLGVPVKGIQSGHQTFTSQFIYFSKSMVVSRASRVRGVDLGFFVFSKLKCSWECQALRALEQKTVSSPVKSKVDQACAWGLHTVSRGLH